MKKPKISKKKYLLLAVGFLSFLTGLLIFYLNQPKNIKENVAKPQSSVGVGVETDPTPLDKSQQLEIGTSTNGKPINGYVFGDGDDVTLMFGSIHGNEMGTADLLNKLIEYINKNPQSVAASKKLVIIPVLNPDGYYDRVDKLNANEVNLNLNFGTSDWAMYGSEGQYAGPSPWSEVESRVLRAVVETYLPNQMISYHSNGSLVNPELTEASQELAWWYAVESGYYYFADPSWDYSGTATKWFEETYSKPAITVELNDHYSNDWEMNMGPMLKLLK